jgi:Zn-dependent protease with chaperone function
MFAILPLVAALVIAAVAGGLGATPSFTATRLLDLAGSLLLWTAGVGLASRRLLRSGATPRAAARLEAVGTVSLLGLHTWWCVGLGWPPGDSSLLALVPIVAGLTFLWWCRARIQHHRTNDPAPAGIVRIRLQLGVLPLALAMALLEPGEWLLATLLTAAPTWLQPALAVVGGLSLLGGLLVLLPPLLVVCWRARPLPAGPAATALAEVAARSGVRFRHLLCLPTGRGRLPNAMALGLVARWRYILITDQLLAGLDPDQLRGVLGHELGHLRHRHLLLYIAFLAAAGVWAELLAPGIGAMLASLPGIGHLDHGLLNGAALLGLWLVLLRGGFGVLSRACEREADLAGVALCHEPVNMQRALIDLARQTGIEPDAPNWRHHSITDRIDFLEQAHCDPLVALHHHRRVMRLRTLVWAGLFAGILLLLLTNLATRRTFTALVASHPELNAALVAAVETHDYDPLQRWLTDQDAHQRRFYALAVQDLFDAHRLDADERKLRSYIHYLMPFRKLSTDDDALDAELQNTIAYALATGRERPSPDDLAILRDLLTGLVAYHQQAPCEAWADTIGCVQFVLGDRAAAKDAFGQALKLMKQTSGEEPPVADGEVRHPTRTEQLRLFRLRRQACDTPDALLPRYWNGIVE